MSIALTATSSDGSDDLYVPIATNEDFRELWLPGCRALNLALVPLLESPGIVFHDSDPTKMTIGTERLLDELRSLLGWAKAADAGLVVERLERLLSTLAVLDPRRFDCIYLG